MHTSNLSTKTTSPWQTADIPQHTPLLRRTIIAPSVTSAQVQYRLVPRQNIKRPTSTRTVLPVRYLLTTTDYPYDLRPPVTTGYTLLLKVLAALDAANVVNSANVVLPGGVVFSANSGMLWRDKRMVVGTNVNSVMWGVMCGCFLCTRLRD
jgi:hypothetical protein